MFHFFPLKVCFAVTDRVCFPPFVFQVWANYEEKPVEEVVHVTEEKERVANYRAVYVTEICDTLHFYTQDVETGECKNA